MIKVIILGHKGMLGHMVNKAFHTLENSDKLEVITIDKRFPKWEKSMFEDIDFVINCIGAIPQKTKKFDINWQIPEWLEKNTKCKIIHPSTDCEMDDDSYGLSKKRAADFIISKGKKTKMLQTSIIGPEIDSNASLLEWFLSQKGEIFGYTKAMWNGNTTYEWSKFCLDLIFNWDNYKKHTILASNTVSKYELLNMFKEIYDKKDITIKEKDLGKDKTLKGDLITKNIQEQLWELKNLK